MKALSPRLGLVLVWALLTVVSIWLRPLMSFGYTVINYLITPLRMLLV